MARLLAFLLIGSLADAPAQPPVIVGVTPPGVTIDGRTTLRIAGRDLLGVDAIVVDPPGGLHWEAIGVAPGGSALSVAVIAAPDTAPGVRLIRIDGPGGVSNPFLIRVDPFPQAVEAERRGEAPPQAIAVGTAVAGTLRALDVDRYRVEGTPGHRVAVDWEARRLGVAIDPLLTATGPDGEALGTARADPTIAGDARLLLVVPLAGWFTVEARDNTYRGSDRAHYRLRVVPDPPPDPPAASDDPRLNQAVPTPLGPGALSLRGTLGAPGAVDRLRVLARAGDRLRVGCRATPPGSPLDPVVTLRDQSGRVVAENDDAPPPPGIIPSSTPDGAPPTEARLDFTAPSDGPLTVEVADRSQGGGAAFGYALEVGPPRDDFALVLLAPDAKLPGSGGAWNLRPGESADIPLVIIPEGSPGTIEVRVEGLPPGIEAEPITVRTAPPKRPGTRAAATAPWDAPPVVDALRLRVAPGTTPARGTFRVVARRLVRGGEPAPDRWGTMAITLDAGIPTTRPVGHPLTEFPVRIITPPTR